MSAQEQMRKMLDELMGTTRNGIEDASARPRFTDPGVCRAFLLNCCPHDILQSTRADLGDCNKIHDPALRADYEMASKKRDYGFEADALLQLNNFLSDIDRRTDVAKKRLAETQESLSAEVNAKAEKVHEFAENIGIKLAEAEKLGNEGFVEESMKKMAEIEDLKKQKYAAEEELRNSMPASTYQQQKLRVCEVCGAYLGLQDNDRRLADHFGGKLHLGFIEIREKHDKLMATTAEKETEREAQRAEREKEREKEREEREKEREERKKERRRSRSRSRSRHRRRSRSRSRSRRRRSRSRDRRRRSRSRDRRRRSRSKESSRRRRRSRSRESRSHSRRHSQERRGSEERRSRDKEERREERPEEEREEVAPTSPSQEYPEAPNTEQEADDHNGDPTEYGVNAEDGPSGSPTQEGPPPPPDEEN